MAPFQRKPLGMVLQGVQSFIHLMIVSLELGGSWGLEQPLAKGTRAASQHEQGIPSQSGSSFEGDKRPMPSHEMKSCVCRFCSSQHPSALLTFPYSSAADLLIIGSPACAKCCLPTPQSLQVSAPCLGKGKERGWCKALSHLRGQQD